MENITEKFEVNAYCDGGFFKNKATWAFLILTLGGQRIYQGRGDLVGPITSMRQVGGELKAVMECIKYCRSHDCIVNIFYDYKGIYYWVSDLFNEKPWKTKNVYTAQYRDFMLNNKMHIKSMTWVKSHSGNVHNEAVDELAKNKIN